MIKEDIPLYKLDLTGTSKFNLVLQEHRSRTDIENSQIFIPPKGPFYQKSFKMYDIAGKLLDEGVDYEFYGIMGKLTQYTGKPVGLFVRILKDSIVQWKMDYQVVGNFNIITDQILKMLQSIYQDDRFVKWENIDNRPLWFIPEIHKQDLAYSIFGFTDLAKELNRIATYVSSTNSAMDFMLESFQQHLEVYIDGYKGILSHLLNSHIDNKHDAHGVKASQIGLGSVDNIATATLDETLDGLRDDLRISIYNAAQAIEATAGRNDKLFPSGSLPILRYGTDTFIPPTITGSFEGLGGLYQPVGAIVETNGEMLMLTRRYNGRVKGLYFIRISNWTVKNPDWEFTAYRYQHPTATADGANLSAIINGSNRHFMIVGDEDKNIWYWCETHGTFDPDKHVLVRITGDWLTDSKNHYWTTVVADENYKERLLLVQPLTSEQSRKIRSSFPTDESTNYGVRYRDGFTFYPFLNLSGSFNRAKLNYKTAAGKTFSEDLFTPYERGMVTVNGKKLIESYHAKFTPPLESVWTVGLFTGYCDPIVNAPLELMLRLEYIIWTFKQDGSGSKDWIPYRTKIKITGGSKPVIDFTPDVGEQKLYSINVDNMNPGVLEYDDFMKYKHSLISSPDVTDDFQGYARLQNGYVVYYNSAIGSEQPSVPGTTWIGRHTYLENSKDVLDLTTPSYTSVSYTVSNELNPIGLGAGLINQAMAVSTAGDYTTAGMIGRQGTLGDPNLGTVNSTKWIFRTINYLNSGWGSTRPSQSMTINNKTVLNYPFVNDVIDVDLGPQVSLMFNSVLNGVSSESDYARRRFNKIFNADAWSNIKGISRKGTGNADARAMGDDLWVKECQSVTEDNVLTFKPVTVINVRQAIENKIKPALTAAGFDISYVDSSWTLAGILDPIINSEYQLFQCGRLDPVNKKIYVAAVIVSVTGVGTPTTVDGYSYYANSDATIKSSVKSIEYFTDLSGTEFFAPGYDGSNIFEHSAVSWSGYNETSNTARSNVAVVRSLCRANRPADWEPLDVLYEFSQGGTNIVRMGYFRQNRSGLEQRWVLNPWIGNGSVVNTRNMMEGAGIISQRYSPGSGVTYDAMMNNLVGTDYTLGLSNLLVIQFVVYFNKIQRVLLAGKMYDIPATYIDLQTVDSSPANKTFYIYLVYNNGQAVYSIVKDIKPETSTQSLIGIVYCGSSQIDKIVPYNRFTMDGAQVSAKRQGSSILASSGSVFDIGDVSTILLDSDFIS